MLIARALGAAGLAATILAVAPPSLAAETGGDYARPIGDAPATRNPTPYTPALICLSRQPLSRPMPRISVGRISDMTGKADFETGAKISQGASLFAITALGKAGFPVVERLDNSVAEIELNYARQRLLSDTPELAGSSGDNFRRILAGQIAGSSYYIVGGVTELNYNIRSTGADAQVGDRGLNGLRAGAAGQTYVLNIAIDLRLVNSRSQEVVDMVSYQKQLVGRSLDLGLSAGNDTLGAAASYGRSGMEPMQAAVRTLVERGVFELVAGFRDGKARDFCLDPLTEPRGPTLPAYSAQGTSQTQQGAR